jgi:hypothetical protein
LSSWGWWPSSLRDPCRRLRHLHREDKKSTFRGGRVRRRASSLVPRRPSFLTLALPLNAASRLPALCPINGFVGALSFITRFLQSRSSLGKTRHRVSGVLVRIALFQVGRRECSQRSLSMSWDRLGRLESSLGMATFACRLWQRRREKRSVVRAALRPFRAESRRSSERGPLFGSGLARRQLCGWLLAVRSSLERRVPLPAAERL